MKNKFKVIDISIVSTYMGRYLTAVVVVLVLAITISALFTPDDLFRSGGVIVLGVAPRGDREATIDHYEALRDLVERRTGALVKMEVCEESWPETCDLFVMSVHEFERLHEAQGLVAACSVEPVGGYAAAAVIAARSGGERSGPVRRDEVLFTAPYSINGCWLQLRALEQAGEIAVGPLEKLTYAPPAGNAERVVYAVVGGEFRMGAVPWGVVTRMIAEGKVGRDEFRVVLSLPPLPEVVLCRRDRGETAPAWLSALTGPPGDEPMESQSVLRPVHEDDMERLEALFEYITGRS